jgi:hypothetical protein
MKEKRFGALSSEVNPDQLSATVTGILIYFSAFLIAFAAKRGIALTQSDVAVSAAQIGQAVGVIWGLFGLIRKLLVKSSDAVLGRRSL